MIALLAKSTVRLDLPEGTRLTITPPEGRHGDRLVAVIDQVCAHGSLVRDDDGGNGDSGDTAPKVPDAASPETAGEHARTRILAVIPSLGTEAFTKSGPPKVAAVRAALPGETVTGEDVIAAWDAYQAAQAEGGAAS